MYLNDESLERPEYQNMGLYFNCLVNTLILQMEGQQNNRMIFSAPLRYEILE
jgi:hypothetical protein